MEDLRGFRSMQTFCEQSRRKEGGVSDTTCWMRSLVFRYSTKRFMKLRKWSAFRMLPGTASAHTHGHAQTHTCTTHTHTHTSHHTHFEQSWPWDLTQLKTYFFFFFFSLVLCIFCLEKGSTPKCCMESGVNSSFNSSSGVRGSIPLKNAFFTRTAQYKSYLLLLLITFRVRALTSCPSSQMFSTRP